LILCRIETMPAEEVYTSAQSYFGLFLQSKSHANRAELANAVRRRGHSVDREFTHTYP